MVRPFAGGAALVLAALATPLAAQVPDTTIVFAHRVPTTPAFRSGFVLFRTQLHAGEVFVAETATRDSVVAFSVQKPAVGDSIRLIARHYWLNTIARATLIEADTLFVRTPVIVVPPPDTVPPDPRPATVRIIAGDSQRAALGARLPDSLVLEVRDSSGAPYPGVQVLWRPVDAQSGRVFGVCCAPVTDLGTTDRMGSTDAAGRSFVRWELGSGTGAQHVEAVLGSIDAMLTFTANAPAPIVMGDSVWFRSLPETIPLPAGTWQSSDTTIVRVAAGGATSVANGTAWLRSAQGDSVFARVQQVGVMICVQAAPNVTAVNATTTRALPIPPDSLVVTISSPICK